MRTLTLAAGFVAALLFSAPALASRDFVTGPAPKSFSAAARDSSFLIVRSRGVTLSLPSLEKAAADAAPILRIAFFDDAVYDFVIAHTETTQSGGMAYVGYAVGAPLYAMILVNNQGTISMKYAAPGRRFSIRGTPEGGYVSREHVEYDRPDHPPSGERIVSAPVALPSFESAKSKPVYVPPSVAQHDDGSTMDVMVVYTTSARVAAGGTSQMNADVDAEIVNANTAYSNSSVVQRLRLVYKAEEAYTEVDMDTDLPRLENPNDGFLDDIPILRDLYHADFVSFWGTYTDFCGLGSLMATESSTFAPDAYNVVAAPACIGPGAGTFAHELGHNMGLRHDHYVDPTGNPSTNVTPEGSSTATGIFYAHGYVDVTNRFRTTMAYNNQCSDSGFNCFRIQYFSNPALNWSNSAFYAPAITAPVGTLTGNQANAHQALNDTRETTANFRTALSSFTGPGIVTFLPATFTVSKGGGSVALRVSRQVGSTGAISVQYATAPGTAVAGTDYTTTSGTLNWADGDASDKSINVSVNNNGILEGTVTFTVALTNPTGSASIGSSGGISQSGTVRIIDNVPDTFPVGGSFPGHYVTPNNPNANTPNSQWSVTLNDGYHSPNSLQSAQAYSPDTTFTNFGNSDLTYTGDFIAGNVSFAYKLSGYQSGISGFVFMIDGVSQPGASNTNGGEVPWTAASVPITAGTHMLTWRFQNQLYFPCAFASPAATGGANCADRAWVDSVSLPLAKKMDFDATGKTDLLWSNTDGRAAIWLMNGVAATATQEIIGAATGWSVVHVADFNGDGKSDLVWQHTDGRMAIYLMNGTTPTTTTQLLNAGAWSVIHTPDLNGDGKADLVFENTDGTTAVWTMNGTTMTGGASIIGAGTGWHVTKTGDFDGDGNADLLWTHTDGRVAIWLMNGATVKATGQILNAGSGWSVAHVADLDGDGKADIVWQHTDGSVALWLMNGTVMSTGSGLLGAGTGWHVQRVADFDGDGKADLLFQHTDGRAAIYLMNGLVPKATQQILAAGGGWTATRTGDLNGDGKADIVWSNADGRTAIWLMNGTSTLQTQGLGVLTGWSVSPISQ